MKRIPFDVLFVGQHIVSARHAGFHIVTKLADGLVFYQELEPYTGKVKKGAPITHAFIQEVRDSRATDEAHLVELPNAHGAAFEGAACAVFIWLGVENLRRWLRGDGQPALVTPERSYPASAEILPLLERYCQEKYQRGLSAVDDHELASLSDVSRVRSWTDFYPQFKSEYRMSLQLV